MQKRRMISEALAKVRAAARRVMPARIQLGKVLPRTLRRNFIEDVIIDGTRTMRIKNETLHASKQTLKGAKVISVLTDSPLSQYLRGIYNLKGKPIAVVNRDGKVFNLKGKLIAMIDRNGKMDR